MVSFMLGVHVTPVQIRGGPPSYVLAGALTAAISASNNRESESGSLRIELHSYKNMERVSGIPISYGYTVTIG